MISEKLFQRVYGCCEYIKFTDITAFELRAGNGAAVNRVKGLIKGLAEIGWNRDLNLSPQYSFKEYWAFLYFKES
jgi:hypothetical protein